jgi:hypothetical protein
MGTSQLDPVAGLDCKTAAVTEARVHETLATDQHLAMWGLGHHPRAVGHHQGNQLVFPPSSMPSRLLQSLDAELHNRCRDPRFHLGRTSVKHGIVLAIIVVGCSSALASCSCTASSGANFCPNKCLDKWSALQEHE